MNIRVLVVLESPMMYLGFQSLFWGREQDPIFSRGSLKEQIEHRKGNKGLGSLMIERTKFS